MSGRDALRALAARCEAAEGPSRELDAEITVALTEGATGVERPPLDGLTDEPQAGWLLTFDTPRPWTERWVCVPAYTASLDAALTLVPEGWRWSLDYTQRAPYQDCGCAALFAPGDGIKPPDVPETYARTPALALCAAALLALAEGRE